MRDRPNRRPIRYPTLSPRTAPHHRITSYNVCYTKLLRIHARNEGIIEPILVGDTEEIYAIARNFNLNLSGIEIIHEQSVQACIRISVQLVRNGDADIIMKGALKTPDLLRGVLNSYNFV